MRIINLTGKTVSLQDRKTKLAKEIWPSSGHVRLVRSVYSRVDLGMPIYKFEVEGVLPPSSRDIIYIVNKEIFCHFRHRKDLIAPGELQMEQKNQIFCYDFLCN